MSSDRQARGRGATPAALIGLAQTLAALVALAALAASAAPSAAAAAAPAVRKAHASSKPASSPAAATPAAGAEPWDGEPFSADPLAMAQAASRFTGQEDEPVVVLLSDQRYSLDTAGRETYTQRLVYRIITAAADTSWSTVERNWSPWHQARPEVRARVITPDGVAHALDPTILTESGEVPDGPDMFGDGRVLRGPLPATGPGAVVEQEVTVRDIAPFFDAGIVEVADVAASVAVHHGRVVVEAPAGTELRYVARLLPDAPPRDETVAGPPPVRRLTFEYHDLPADDDAETGLPPEVPRNAYLAFSTGRSWSDIARRYSAIVDAAIHAGDHNPQAAAGTHGERAELAQLLRAAGGPATSQIETMNRVLERMGGIRYTGVELGQGGVVPRSPGETLRRKFGDCKDKAVLLIAALRALDIPAYAALLNAGEDSQDIEPDLPGFGGFNHAIVVVPGSPSVWIDPTDRFARAGELPIDDQGRLALIASPTATGLVRTPESAAADNRAVKTREFFLADQGAARAVETDEYWGAAERDLRAFYTSEDADTLRESLSEYMRKAYLSKELASYDHANPFDLSHPFRLRLEARETRRAVTDEKGAVVAILPSALLDQLPEEITSQDHDRQHQPRQSDYYFSRPFSTQTIYRIVPPPGFAARPLPADRIRHLGPVTLSEVYAAGRDGVVTATLSVESGKRRINAQEFEALRAAAHELADARPVVIQFEQIGEANLAAGRLREAIAEFQHEATAAPKKALPHCRLARALLAGGLGEAARREASRATRLEPRSVLAWRTTGWVLEHDVIGRRFGPGFDRAGALAAYRKAKALDPDDEATRADLAILLEHDTQGHRYAAGADLAAAIAEYQDLRTALKRRSLDDNLLIAMLRAERFSEVLALAGEMDATPARDALRLAATAATTGPDAAIREAEMRAGDATSLVSILDTAAQELVSLRRYREAAALLSRAAQQSSNAAAFLTRAEALRRAAGLRQGEAAEPGAPPAAGPAAVARCFLLAAVAPSLAAPAACAGLPHPAAPAAPGAAQRDDGRAKHAPRTARSTPPEPDPAAGLLGLLSKGLTRALSQRARRELIEAPGRGVLDAPSAAIPADIRQDLVLSAWHETVQGDDRTGYRVEIAVTLGEVPGRTALFLVAEDGGYRIAAFGDAPATLGFEALRRLAEHDLSGARRWLDWAAAEVARQAPPAGLAWATLAGGGEIELPPVPLLALWPPAAVSATSAAAQAPANAAAGDAEPAAAAAATAPDAATAGCAAAVLAAEGLDSPDGIAATAGTPGAGSLAASILARLTACRDSAASDARRLAVEVAIAGAYRGLGLHRELLAAGRRLAAVRPDSAIAFAFQAEALTGLGGWAELSELAQRRLAAHPDDVAALRIAARGATRRGDLESAAVLLRQVAGSGRESAADLNQLAWLALVRGHPDDQAVEDAQRAAALSHYRDATALHTLASLYAERGRPAEAYRIILQSIDARPAGAGGLAGDTTTATALSLPSSTDWFVFGHLAESYGLPDEARRLYAKVLPGRPEESPQLSTFRLAQARLAALGTVKEVAAAAGTHRGRG
jgi:transglutaminase-like putative cysteine protease